MRNCGQLALCLSLLLMHGCSLMGLSTDMKNLQGQAFYRERIALPPGAQLSVTLEDVSQADAPSRVIARQDQRLESAPPYPFTLAYNPDDIQAGGRYSVRATIRIDNHLQFTTTQQNDPFVEGVNPEQLSLLLLRTGPKGVQSPALLDTYWHVTQLTQHPKMAPKGDKPVFLELNAKSHRVRGFSGCNTFGGGFLLDKQTLSFDKLFGTMMLCEAAMDFEQALLDALSRVTHYELSQDQLVLKGKDGKPLIKAEATLPPAH